MKNSYTKRHYFERLCPVILYGYGNAVRPEPVEIVEILQFCGEKTISDGLTKSGFFAMDRSGVQFGPTEPLVARWTLSKVRGSLESYIRR